MIDSAKESGLGSIWDFKPDGSLPAMA